MRRLWDEELDDLEVMGVRVQGLGLEGSSVRFRV